MRLTSKGQVTIPQAVRDKAAPAKASATSIPTPKK